MVRPAILHSACAGSGAHQRRQQSFEDVQRLARGREVLGRDVWQPRRELGPLPRNQLRGAAVEHPQELHSPVNEQRSASHVSLL